MARVTPWDELLESLGLELQYAYSTLLSLPPLMDAVIEEGEVRGLYGNMAAGFNTLTVKGTLILADQSLLHTFNGIIVDGGRVVVEDNAAALTEVVL